MILQNQKQPLEIRIMTNDKMVSYIKQAFELKEEKCYKQAIETFYKALELENDNQEILFQIGELYYYLLNYPRAIHYLERILSKNPEHTKSLSLMKDICLAENKLESALEYTEKLLAIEKTPKNFISAIEIYCKMHNIEKINEYLNLPNIEVKVAIAKALYTLNNQAQAENILQDILKNEPENNNALILLGKIEFNKGEILNSEKILSKVKLDTENAELENYLGLFAMEKSDFTTAIQHFSKACLNEKNNHRYLYNLGNAYYFNGWIKEATNTYLSAIRLDDQNLDYRYSLAYLYYQVQDYAKTKNEVEYILSIDENHYKTKVLEALLKFHNKDFLGAKNILENNIRLNDNDIFTKLSLVKVYKELGIIDKARKIISEVLECTSENTDFVYELADIHYRNKKYTEAIELLNKIQEKKPHYIKAYTLLSDCYLKLDDIENAKTQAQETISLDMNYASGYYNLAQVREKEKDYEEAIECMKHAIMLDLNNAEYYAYMSDLYFQNENLPYAFEYIKEACEIDDSTIYKNKFTVLAGKNRKNKKDLEKHLP